jgi:hypothetical protein
MLILVTEKPSLNGYIESLIRAYQELGHDVICDPHNFFFSNVKPDVVHIHWPERLSYWFPAFQGVPVKNQLETISARLRWYRSHKAKIVHTIHNLQPHDQNQPGRSDPVYQLIVDYADILVHHCETSVDMLASEFPSARDKLNIVCHHGDYLLNYKKITKEMARQTLGIPRDRFVILNFGRQKPYKGEDLITKILKNCGIREKYLLTVGDFAYPRRRDSYYYFLKIRNIARQKVRRPDRKYIYRAIPDDEVPVIMNCADLVLLGQRRGLNSGQLPLAATYGVPAVFPAIGCFAESIENWVGEKYEPGSVTSAVAAIRKLYDAVKQEPVADNSAWLDANSWAGHARKILNELNRLP